MKKTTASCPVPIEQQPIYEYNSLKNSMFFFWTMEDLKSYLKKTVSLIFLTYLIVTIFLQSTAIKTDPVNNIIINSVVTDVLIILYFFRLYLGWDYVYKRLVKATISYEESGWYDGQVWVKTPDILMKDRLIADYILLPVLKRIKLTLATLIIYLIIYLINQ